MTLEATPPQAVARAFALEGARFTPIAIGLINRTWRVDRPDGPSLALQRLHPVFRGEVNVDIDAITRHLEARGLLTPRIVPTVDGALWLEHEGAPFRALTWLPGTVAHRIESPRLAETAASLAARFHRAVSDLDHAFRFTRPGAHDTDAHLRRLERAASAHADAEPDVRAIADAVLAHARTREPLPTTRTRIVHGDLKITNVLLDDSGESARALLDLDTMAHGTIPVELGDALRSWCNRAGESDEGAAVDVEIFEAAAFGYARGAGDLLDRDEVDALALGLETIALELSSRFALDAFEDRYFGWDASRYPSRRAHNVARARSQLALSRSARAQRARLERAVRTAFSS